MVNKEDSVKVDLVDSDNDTAVDMDNKVDTIKVDLEEDTDKVDLEEDSDKVDMDNKEDTTKEGTIKEVLEALVDSATTDEFYPG